MTGEAENLVEWGAFARARAQLGAEFTRIIGYFRADGEKAITAIEEALRRHAAAAIVLPAHTLKGDAAQLGATRIAALAEHLELVARRCVEDHDTPDELIAEVVPLRPLFRDTLALFDREVGPQPTRRAPAAFGRRATR